MSSYPPNIWNQLKNITADEIIGCLKKTGWEQDTKIGPIYVFRHHGGKRVTIHYHPHKTYQANLLKHLLDDIGWTDKQMRDIKLIK